MKNLKKSTNEYDSNAIKSRKIISNSKKCLILILLFCLIDISRNSDPKTFVQEKLIINKNKHNIYSKTSNTVEKQDLLNTMNFLEKGGSETETNKETKKITKNLKNNKKEKKEGINVNKYLKEKYDIDLGSSPFMDLNNLFDKNDKNLLDIKNPFENKNFINLIRRVNQLTQSSKVNSNIGKNNNLLRKINENLNDKIDHSATNKNKAYELENVSNKVEGNQNKKLKRNMNANENKNLSHNYNNIIKNQEKYQKNKNFRNINNEHNNKNDIAEKLNIPHINDQLATYVNLDLDKINSDWLQKKSQNKNIIQNIIIKTDKSKEDDDSYPFDNEENTNLKIDLNHNAKNAHEINILNKVQNLNKDYNNTSSKKEEGIQNPDSNFNYIHDNLDSTNIQENKIHAIKNNLENNKQTNIKIIKLNKEQIDKLHQTLSEDQKINLIITPTKISENYNNDKIENAVLGKDTFNQEKKEDFDSSNKDLKYSIYTDKYQVQVNPENGFLNSMINENIDSYAKQKIIKDYPLKNQIDKCDKKKSDFLDEVDEDTEKIFNNMCAMSESLEVSIDKINLELDSLKNFREIKTSNLNKQKILIKFAKLINRINYIIVEMTLIEDLIKTLTLSNCESLERLNRKFEHANETAPQIIQNIQDYLKNKNFSLSIFILSK